MSKPVISIIATAARPENWMRLYQSIGQNNVDFEVVFVGPNPPIVDMPDNFRFIQSNVKPAQCVEIAARNAEGELLLIAADDMLFTGKAPLDEMLSIYRQQDDDLSLISVAVEGPEGVDRFYQFDMSSPLVALSPLMSADLWRRIGGIDRRFIAVSWDIDITFRVGLMGGRVVPSNVVIDADQVMPDIPDSKGSILPLETSATDRGFLNNLWEIDGENPIRRKLPFERIPDENILTRSQNPRGRWKYQNETINRLLSIITTYKLRQWRSATIGRTFRFVLRHSPSFLAKQIIKLRPGTRY